MSVNKFLLLVVFILVSTTVNAGVLNPVTKKIIKEGIDLAIDPLLDPDNTDAKKKKDGDDDDDDDDPNKPKKPKRDDDDDDDTCNGSWVYQWYSGAPLTVTPAKSSGGYIAYANTFADELIASQKKYGRYTPPNFRTDGGVRERDGRYYQDIEFDWINGYGNLQERQATIIKYCKEDDKDKDKKKKSDDDDDDTTKPKPKKKKSDDDDDSDPTKPKKPKSDDDDDSDPTKPKKPKSDDDDDSDPTKPKKKKSDDDDDDDTDPTKPKKKKDGDDDDDDSDGKDGKNGKNGKKGDDGDDGKDGDKGDKGDDGDDGKNGKNGKNGKDGKDADDDDEEGQGLGDFCTWAKPVCDFIKWAMEEPPEPEPPIMPKDTLFQDDRFKTYVNFEGTCPTGTSLSFVALGRTVSYPVNYQPFCDFLEQISWWLVAFTLISTGAFVVRSL